MRDPSLVQRVPMRAFGNAKNVKPGMQFQAQTSEGRQQVVTVTGIQGDMVTVDANHPLAGENLHFEVEITDIREASQEELEHGHVHGPGGHHHHELTLEVPGATSLRAPRRSSTACRRRPLAAQGRAGTRKSLFSAASVCGSRP